MKKIYLLIAIYSLLISPAFASCDYLDKCAPEAYGISSKAGQTVSKFSGMTFLTEKIAQAIIKKELKKETKEKFKVEMKSFSVKDLVQGKFKSLNISGKNLEMDGVYLTSLEIKTLCDFNYVKLEKKAIKFEENMVIGFETEISDTDLRKTMKSSGYLEMLNKINLSPMGMTLFKLEGADVRIKNNKLYFTINVKSGFLYKPMPIVIAADVKVEDGRIVLTKVDLVNMYTRIDLSNITYILNSLNPLTFSIDVLENKDTKLSVQKVDIIGDKIIVNGNVFIPKNTVKK